MPAESKEAQRSEFHKTLWRMTNELRGSVYGWDFKSYVLGLLFYRFISENLTTYINQGEHEAGDADFDYTKLPDDQAELRRAGTVQGRKSYVLPSELFISIKARAAHDENLNEVLERGFKLIEGSAVGTASEDDFKGIFDRRPASHMQRLKLQCRRHHALVKEDETGLNDQLQ